LEAMVLPDEDELPQPASIAPPRTSPSTIKARDGSLRRMVPRL
jgi:hypothetical protein